MKILLSLLLCGVVNATELSFSKTVRNIYVTVEKNEKETKGPEYYSLGISLHRFLWTGSFSVKYDGGEKTYVWDAKKNELRDVVKMEESKEIKKRTEGWKKFKKNAQSNHPAARKQWCLKHKDNEFCKPGVDDSDVLYPSETGSQDTTEP